MGRSAALDLDKVDASDAHRTRAEAEALLRNLSVIPATSRSYESALKAMEAFACKIALLRARGSRGAKPQNAVIDETMFINFLASIQKQKQGMPVNVERYRSSLVFHNDAGQYDFACTKAMIKKIKGLKFQAGRAKTTKKRGTVTDEMLEELMDWVREYAQKGRGPAMCECIWITFHCALRIEELLFAKADQVLLEKRCLKVRSKAYRQDTMSKRLPYEEKKVHGDETWRLLVERKKKADRAGHNRLLFPVAEFSVHQLRGAVKAALEDLQWDVSKGGENLKWSLHSLRHGGVASLLKKGISDKDLLMCDRMVIKYSQSNEKRARGVESAKENLSREAKKARKA